MNLDQILREERVIWDGVAVCGEPVSLERVAVVLGKILGDLCCEARKVIEGGEASEVNLQREFGNLITSTVRWIDDLGLDADDCIAAALRAQRVYVAR